MSRLSYAAAASLLAVATVAAAAPAAKTASTAKAGAAAPTTTAAAKPTLTADAKGALDAMSNYLRTLKTFELTADGTSEIVADSGQKLEFGAQLHYLVTLPDKLFAEINTGTRSRQMYYDGAKLTIVAPEKGYYTDVPLTGSVPTLLARASEEYGIELPLSDLFRWGNAGRPIDYPASGYKVGIAKCGTATCDQYAFRQPGVDWQLWIQQGGKPLPVRIVITGTLSREQPQTAVNLTWNTDTPIAATKFAYAPAAGANRIAIKSIAEVEGKK